MKIELTNNQREFLERAIKLYSRYPDLEFPRTRINNILYNGYYYDDKSSQTTEPIESKTQTSDKVILNLVGQTLRKYYKELETYYKVINI